MKMVWMNGGLGNQLFQYIFYRYLEEKSGDICYIDDRFFFQRQQHFGYEINKIFGLTPNLLSNFFDEDVWEEVLKATKSEVNIIDFFNDSGLPLQVVSEGSFISDYYKNHSVPYTGKLYSFAANTYSPEIVKLQGDTYYHGYYINMNWFKDILDLILRDLKFPEIDDEYNMDIAKKIGYHNSVAVHIRRGDFVTLGWSLEPDWYRQAVDAMKQTVAKPIFYIFSDDAEWCRSNLETLGFDRSDRIVFVEGNTGGKNFRDMQLMTLCKNLIIANSSFSYLAALLNRQPGKCVINPISSRQIF